MRRSLFLLVILCLVSAAFINTAISQDISQDFTIGRGAIQRIAWQPNGDTLLVSTESGAWLYNSELDDVLHLPTARLASFSPDGQTIAGVNADNEITLWDASTFQLLATLQAHENLVLDLAWRPGGTTLASLDSGGTLFLWDTDTHEMLNNFDAASAEHLLWSQSGSYIAGTRTLTDEFTVWDIEGQVILSKEVASPYGYGVSFVWRDDSHIVRSTGYSEWTQVLLFDVTTAEVRELSRGMASEVAYNPRSNAFAIADWLNGTYVYSDDTLTTLEFHAGAQTTNAEWSPDGRYLAVGSWQAPAAEARHVWIVDAATGTTLWDLADAHDNMAYLRWNSDASKITVVDRANVIYIYDIASGELSATSEVHGIVGSAIAWDDTGSHLAVGDSVGAVRVWDTSGSLVATFAGHQQPVTEIAWRPHSSMLATYSGDFWQSIDNNVYMWDWREGEQPIIAFPHKQNIVDMAWSPDGVWLAVAPRDDRIDLWSMPTSEHRELATWEPETLTGVEWSIDGSVIAAAHSSPGNGGYVNLWDSVSGELMEGGVGLYASNHVWTADNRLLGVTWGYYGCGGMPRPIYDVSFGTGYGVGIDDLTLSGLKDEVASAVISPDGQRVAGFDRDQDMIIWDIQTAEAVFNYQGASAIVWSPDSQIMALVTTTNQTLLLDADTFELLQTFEGTWQILWSPDSQHYAQMGYGLIYVQQAF
ncbi:MAG: hypothetical protein U0694_23430 [Anaerolineae bacterium]